MKKTKVIYPGSFDPFTLGHLDMVQRISKIFDDIVIGVLVNPEKKMLFSLEERKEMIRNALYEANIGHVIVEDFNGLLIDFAKDQKATVIARGIRTSKDFDYELQMAHANRHLDKMIETIFLPTSVEYSYISSTIIKQIGLFGGDITALVPAVNILQIAERLKENE